MKSITDPKKYLAYVMTNNTVELPTVPERCIVSYSSALIDMAQQSFPHKTVDLGCSAPAPIYFFNPEDTPPFVMMRGLHGSPLAAVMLEELIALGLNEFLVVGSAGHPVYNSSPTLAVGDLVIPTEAHIFEGTSGHYDKSSTASRPHHGSLKHLQNLLTDRQITYQAGPVATTDALYRETPDFISGLARHQVIAIDMELSALFTVATHHHKPLAGLLYLSDLIEVSGTWHLGLLANQLTKLHPTLFTVVKGFVSAP